MLASAVSVLIAATAEWIRGRPAGAAGRLLPSLFLGAVDLQLLLGLSLYLVLSPITRAGRHDFPAALRDSTLRFWNVEHVTMMGLAIALAHAVVVWAGRAQDPRRRARRLALGSGLSLLCMLGGVPWPALAYGRALFRPW